MKNFFERFTNGIQSMISYCAVWMGAVLTYLIIMDSKTDWWFKLITIIYLLVMFLLGFFSKNKEKNVY